MRRRFSHEEHRRHTEQGAAAGEANQQRAETAAREHVRAVKGRRAVQPVLDHEGNLMLGQGEVVTHRVIERARRAGLLDKLLNAVSWEEPQIDQAEERGPELGEEPLAHQGK